MKYKIVPPDVLHALRYPRIRLGLRGLAVAGLTLMAVMGVVWWPNWHVASGLHRQIDAQRRANVETVNAIAVAASAERATVQLEHLQQKLRSATSQAALVDNLSKLARQAQVKILSESYEQGKTQDGTAPLVHELVVQGSYRNVRQMLVSLQSLPSLTIIQDAALSRDVRSGLVKAHMRLLTFRKAIES